MVRPRECSHMTGCELLDPRAKLLHVGPRLDVSNGGDPNATSTLAGEKPAAVEPHPDERQVRLDTDRSFVLYPVGEPFFHLQGRAQYAHERNSW